MPEITVVITAYNLEKQLPQCFDELLSQTFQGYEILALDDCSTDGTAEVVREYAAREPERIKPLLLDTNLGGPAKTRNAALDSGLIDGKYIVFLDGDDHVEPDFLERLYSACESTGAEAAVCAYDRVEQDTGRVLCHELTWLNGCISLPPNDDRMAFLNGALWNKMFLFDIVRDLRSPDIKGGQDLLFGLRILQRCGSVACVPGELIHYQVRGGSVSTRTPENDMHALALEIKAQYDEANAGWKETLALISFLHIGLSMALRASANPQIEIGGYLKWATAYMRDDYGFYREMRLFRLGELRKRGAKGWALWGSLMLYRTGCFRIALAANRMITKLFHVDIKF